MVYGQNVNLITVADGLTKSIPRPAKDCQPKEEETCSVSVPSYGSAALNLLNKMALKLAHLKLMQSGISKIHP